MQPVIAMAHKFFPKKSQANISGLGGGTAAIT